MVIYSNRIRNEEVMIIWRKECIAAKGVALGGYWRPLSGQHQSFRPLSAIRWTLGVLCSVKTQFFVFFSQVHPPNFIPIINQAYQSSKIMLNNILDMWQVSISRQSNKTHVPSLIQHICKSHKSLPQIPINSFSCLTIDETH